MGQKMVILTPTPLSPTIALNMQALDVFQPMLIEIVGL
jgi:hypothetical protein